MTQNTIQKYISIVFCVSAIRHELSPLGKYRKQKQSPPGTKQRHTEGRLPRLSF